MKNSNRSISYIFGIAGTLICISLFMLQVPPAFAQDPIPTPTYDPFAQPELPPNPTELEIGRYLFWRHCMPCHGDLGQGLTDEFRALWEDHANCWDRGCHGGKKEDEGFPIPTVIPAIVTEEHLKQFTSEEKLFEFLKTTHPPQHPGYLEEEEYHDIAVILLNMNNRSSGENITSPTPTYTPAPSFTFTPVTMQSDTDTQSNTPLLVAGFGILSLAISMVLATRKFRRKGS